MPLHTPSRVREVGFRPPANRLWFYESRALDLLSPLAAARVLSPSTLTDARARAPAHVRYPYVTTIAPSADGALLAVTTSDGRVEVHQPAAVNAALAGAERVARPEGEAGEEAEEVVRYPSPDSLRLSIVLADLSVRAADMVWEPRADVVVLGLGDRSALWTFDIETCREDVPCHVRKLSAISGGVDHSVTDLAVVKGVGCVVAACRDKRIYMSDVRVRKPVGVFDVAAADNAVAAAEPLVVVCGGGLVKVFDVRMVGKGGMGGRERAVKEVRVPGADGFGFAEAVMGGSRVVVQDLKGNVGLVNMITGGVEISSEPEPDRPKEVMAGTGLFELGAIEQHRRSFPWYIQRRRGVVFPGPMGQGGWRAVVPCVGRRAVRVVPLGLPKLEPAAFLRPTPVPKRRPIHLQKSLRKKKVVREKLEKIIDTSDHVACLAMDEHLQRLVLGLRGNTVDILQRQSELQELN